MDKLAEVGKAVRARDKAQKVFDDADANLRAVIREAITDGVKVRDLMEATGLSKARIYQIRDNTR